MKIKGLSDQMINDLFWHLYDFLGKNPDAKKKELDEETFYYLALRLTPSV